MKRPEQSQIAKLPKWAQDYIVGIEREREVAVRALNEAVNGSDKDHVWYENLLSIGEQQSPSFKRFNVPANTVNFNLYPGFDGSVVTVSMRTHETPPSITVSFEREAMVVVPNAGNQIALVPRPTRRYAQYMAEQGYTE